jgi:hypothetical protein
MKTSRHKLKPLWLAIAFLCNGLSDSLAQTAPDTAELEKIQTRLTKLSIFLAEAGEKEGPNSLSITGEPDASIYSRKLRQTQSEISGSSAKDAIKRLETIDVPPRLQELLEKAPDGSELPLPPHQALGKIKFASLEPFIVGPGASITVDYPSVANITYARAGSAHETICTGTLVSSDAVLTAAHCFCDLAGEDVRTAAKCSSAIYRRGLEPLKPTNTKYFQVFFQGKGPIGVKEIVINPKYNFPTKDLAIMRLSTPVDIMPAPLNNVGPLSSGSYAYVVGFGVHSSFSDDSQKFSDQPISSSQGLKLWATIKTAKCVGAERPQEMICWNFQPRAADAILGSTCHGDSGGPLFAKFNNEWKLAGVTSGGPNTCSFSSQPEQQSYDVDVFGNRDWIKTIAKITPLVGPIKTAFLLDSASTAYAGPYHIFTDQPDEWVSQFYLPPKLKSVTVSINTTPTVSKLVLELRPSNASPSSTCRDERSDSFAACTIQNPTEGSWTFSVKGSRPQELQAVAAVSR